MAMPSMSSPQRSARDPRDMDLLRSILHKEHGNGNDSTHSDTGSDSSSGSQSSSGSSSGSSSTSSRSRTKTTTHERSGNGNFSSDSDSKTSDSKTESQRDDSGGSFGEKSQTETINKDICKDMITEKDSQANLDSVSINGNDIPVVPPIDLKGNDDDNVPKQKKPVRRKRSVKKVIIRTIEKDLEQNHSDNDSKDNESEQYALFENKKRIKEKENWTNSTHDESFHREHAKNNANKSKSGRSQTRHLSKRAQRTLSLYPEQLEGPDRLERNYAELQALLQDQFIDNQYALNEELVKKTKRVLSGHRHRQQGFTGLVTPPAGPPPGGRRVRRIWSASGDRSRAWTQTDLDERELAEHDKKRPQSAKGYYFIDTTKPDHGRKVTFIKEQAAEETADATYKVTMRLGETHFTSKDSPRGRGTKRVIRRPKSAGKAFSQHTVSDERKDSICSNRSQSPRTGPSRRYGTDSESSPSRSRSRSTSTDRFTDHLLKNTDNVKIKEWLREKNKLLRKQRREERTIEREKRKQESAVEKGKLVLHDKSVVVVQKWMDDKQKESRLLRRQQRKHPGKLKFSGKVVVSEIETRDLKNKGGTKGEHKESCQLQDNPGRVKRVIVNMTGQETVKCTCGFVESSRLKREEERQARQAAILVAAKQRKPKPPTVQKSGAGPSTSKGKPTEPDEDDEDTKHLSYDNWLKQKKSADLERRKQEKKKAEELLAQSDPEMDSIISGMAKRRARNILKGKKRIQTGLQEIDDEANKTLDERVAEKQKLNGKAEEVAPSSGSSARFYKWVPKDEGEEVNDAEAAGKKRPTSAKVTSSQTKMKDVSKRPASAKPMVTPARSAQVTGTDESSSVRSSDSPRRSRSTSPKPKLSTTKAYKQVKYQRKSWDEFSDYVWDKLNEESDKDVQAGSGEDCCEDKHDEPETTDGSPVISEQTQKADSNSPDTQETNTTENVKSDLDTDVDGKDAKTDLTMEADGESEPEVGQPAGQNVPDINILASSCDTVELDEDDNTDLRESVTNQCIKEVVAETIFSMTELETDTTAQADAPPGEGNEFFLETRRASSVLENIVEETEDEAGQTEKDENVEHSNHDSVVGSEEQPNEDAGSRCEEQPNQDAEIRSGEQPNQDADIRSEEQSNQDADIRSEEQSNQDADIRSEEQPNQDVE